MRIDTQGWDFWYTAKRVFLVGGALLVVYWIFKPGAPGAPEKTIAPLDRTKPTYTTERAIVCPLILVFDPDKMMKASLAITSYNESDAKAVGCGPWLGGIAVSVHPMAEIPDFAVFDIEGHDYFMSFSALTNNADGSRRYVDSNTAQPSSSTPASTTEGETFDASKAYINTASASPIPPTNSASPSAGSLMVAISSREPILKGNVTAANTHGFGAVICPDSKTFAAYADAFVPNSDEANKKTTSDYETMRRFGCSYFPPGTPMVSEGENPAGSLAVVTTSLPGGRTIKGVVFPNEIVQTQQPESVNQQSQVQGYNPPADRTEAPQEATPVPVENSKPSAQPPSVDEIDQQAIALWNQKRYSDAIPLFNQACSSGNADSCTRLGLMYDFGQGVTQDFSRAQAYYLKACNTGNQAACGNLSILTDYAPGSPECNSTTLALMVNRYRDYCSAGNGMSCDTLGHLYSYGCSVAKDAEQARQLYSKACTTGNQQGCDRLKEMQ